MSIFDNRNIYCIGCEKLAEGKTKIIWQHPVEENIVYIAQKPEITAGDGKKKDLLKDKDIYANRTTCNVFHLLNLKGIPTHFIGAVSDNEFMASKCRMISLEVVIRRIIYGSFLERYPERKKGEISPYPIVEFFLKDDTLHDPIVVFSLDNVKYELYDAHQHLILDINDPEKSKHIKKCFVWELEINSGDIHTIKNIATQVFEALEKSWQNLKVSLVDLKIEFGWTTDGQLVVADVIDNDSWRIWVDGDPNKALDKQNYRDGIKDLDAITSDYALVAELTKKFLTT